MATIYPNLYFARKDKNIKVRIIAWSYKARYAQVLYEEPSHDRINDFNKVKICYVDNGARIWITRKYFDRKFKNSQSNICEYSEALHIKAELDRQIAAGTVSQWSAKTADIDCWWPATNDEKKIAKKYRYAITASDILKHKVSRRKLS